MTDKVRVILIHETVAQSWGRDAGTFAMFVGLIGLGWALDSTPMQWAGFVVAILAVRARPSPM